MTKRLTTLFGRLGREGRGGLSIYLVAGHPDAQRCVDHMDAAIRGGADWLEIGIPFSDPAADGPAIQTASAAAVRSGYTVDGALRAAAAIAEKHPDTPLVCMTYANIAYRRTWRGFAEDLASHGFDACILPDVPLEESGPVREALAAADVGWVPLVTPTTPKRRMAEIAATATGFVYVVSNVGITGQADPGALVEATVARARRAGAQVPLAVGFGIRTADDVARVLAAGADGAIVGSRVVQAITEGADPDATQALVQRLASGTRGRSKA